MELQLRGRPPVSHRELPDSTLYRPRWQTPANPGDRPMDNPFWHLDPEGRGTPPAGS